MLYDFFWKTEKVRQPVEPIRSNNEIRENFLACKELESHPFVAESLWDDFVPKENEKCVSNRYLPKALKCINSPGHAYDLGCCSGEDSRYLHEEGWKVTALDLSSVAIQMVNQLNLPNLHAIHAPLEEFDFPEKADFIVAVDILGFCQKSQVEEIWIRMYEALNDRGHLLCTLPSPNGMYTSWSLGKREVTQFFLDHRYKVVYEMIEEEDPYTTHPLLLILQKV